MVCLCTVFWFICGSQLFICPGGYGWLSHTWLCLRGFSAWQFVEVLDSSSLCAHNSPRQFSYNSSCCITLVASTLTSVRVFGLQIRGYAGEGRRSPAIRSHSSRTAGSEPASRQPDRSAGRRMESCSASRPRTSSVWWRDLCRRCGPPMETSG